MDSDTVLGDVEEPVTSPLSPEEATIRLQARCCGFAARRGVLRAGGRVALLPAGVLKALNLHQLPALEIAPLQELLTMAMQAEDGVEADDEARGDEADDGAVAGDDVDGGFSGVCEGSGPLVSCMLH